jgi:hypothetical protein
MAFLVSRMDMNHEKTEAVIHSLKTSRKEADGLLRNDGGTPVVRGAHLRGN